MDDDNEPDNSVCKTSVIGVLLGKMSLRTGNTERERERERQTDRQTDIETETDRDRERKTETERQRD